MLPSSNLGQATISHNGGHLIVEAKYRKLLELQQETGVDALARVAFLAKSGPMGMVEILARFQVPHTKMKEQAQPDGVLVNVPELDKLGKPIIAEYTQDEIYDWLFGNMKAINDELIMGQIGRAIGIIMGVDVEEEIADAKKATTKKK